ncbi:MAG: hypothetical protein GY862_01300 [Gammaproteobacteria bacterium]|nr:hypothetical protein [Gammaproteobacteria bacterium]
MTTAQCFSRRNAEREMPVNRGLPSAPQKPAALAKLRSALQNMQHALNLTAVSRRLENFDIRNSQSICVIYVDTAYFVGLKYMENPFGKIISRHSQSVN